MYQLEDLSAHGDFELAVQVYEQDHLYRNRFNYDLIDMIKKQFIFNEAQITELMNSINDELLIHEAV